MLGAGYSMGSLALSTPVGQPSGSLTLGLVSPAAPARVSPPPLVESSTPVGTPGPAGVGRRSTIVRWLGVVAMLYLLICAIGVIGDGFKALGADTAASLFAFAENPLVGLFVGVLATALIQSSSTTTMLVVAAVGTGMMPLAVAVPIIMGANIGTSVTNTLAALGHIGDKDEFRRAFAASTVHDFFNLFAVLLLLPIEMIFHPLERLSGFVATHAYGTVLPDPENADFIGRLADPVVDALGANGLLGLLGGGVVTGAATIVAGIVLIFVAVRYLGKLLQALMVGTAKAVLERTVGGRPMVAMGAGAAVTAVVQSSSVTTSMMVPFAGAGTLSTRQIYPLTLGANVGTTFTALLASFAIVGADAQIALQAALVHLLFNVVAIAIIYGLPKLRPLPVLAAERLANLATERKSLAMAWVFTVFLAIPALGVLGSTLI